MCLACVRCAGVSCVSVLSGVLVSWCLGGFLRRSVDLSVSSGGLGTGFELFH